MNYVDSDAVAKAVRAHGFKGCTPDACTKINAFLYRALRATLDLSRAITPQRTVQPEHIALLHKVARALDTPLFADRGAAALLRGGDPTLPATYFGGDESALYTASAAASAATSETSATLSRPSLHASVAFLGSSSQAGGAETTLPARFFDADAPERAYSHSGGAAAQNAKWRLTQEDVNRLLKDYKARGGDVRISDAARAALRSVLEVNLNGALHDARKGAKKRGAALACLSGPAFARVVTGWKLCL